MTSIASTTVDNSIADSTIASKLPKNTAQATNPATATLDSSSSATSGNASLNQNFNDFLVLLTTQLKNQDPTQPLDTNQFVTQLTQLNQLQQQLATNKNLEQLVSASNQAKVASGIDLIGKAVEAKGNSGFLTNSNSAFVYDLPVAATDVSVTILDSNNTPVFSGAGSKYAGKNLVTWGGTNSFTGAQMADGEYHIAIKATDADGKDITATTYTTGRASSVEIAADGTANIVIGTAKIPYADVVAVSEIPDATSTNSSSNSSTNSSSTSNTSSNASSTGAATNTSDTSSTTNTNG